MIELSNYAWFLFLWNRYKEEINLDKPQRSEHTMRQIVVKNHPLCTGWATSSAPSHSNKSLCVYWRISAKIFVSATYRILLPQNVAQINLIDSVRLDAMTKFCCGDKDFCKNSPVHAKWFVTATCCHVLLLQLVAWCVPSLRSLSAVFEKHSH